MRRGGIASIRWRCKVFARSSTIYADVSKIDDGTRHVTDTVMPALSHIDGYVGLSLVVDRDSGRCVATSGWRTEQAMHDAADRVRGIRDSAAEVFGGRVEVEEWEVLVMHRAHHARASGCLRSTWVRMSADQVEQAIDRFKMDTLAKIEDLPGFCSASVLVNRSGGRGVVTVGYDNRDALERSREPSAALREQTSQESGFDVLDVGEFDLAVAHLHIPESV